MSDENLAGGASASVDTTTVADTSTVESARIEDSPRSALDKAFAAVDLADTGSTVVEEDAGGDKPQHGNRNADGTFRAKAEQADQGEVVEQQGNKGKAADPKDAPARFSSDAEAKAGWASTPDPVKAAVNRTIRELEQGVEKYRGDANIYNSVFKPFVELAVASNVDPRAALQGYVNIDAALDQDFGAGLKMIFERKGADPRAWAQAILGQKQEGGQQQPDARDRQISALVNEVKQLRQGFGGISQTLQQQHAQGIDQSLSSYTGSLSDADRALFNELDAEIADILTSDPAISLPDAFTKAKGDAQGRYQRIFGAAPANGAKTTAAAQTRAPGTGGSDPRKGQLSVSGAPGNSQSASARAVPSSPREALDRRFAELGL